MILNKEISGQGKRGEEYKHKPEESLKPSPIRRDPSDWWGESRERRSGHTISHTTAAKAWFLFLFDHKSCIQLHNVCKQFPAAHLGCGKCLSCKLCQFFCSCVFLKVSAASLLISINKLQCKISSQGCGKDLVICQSDNVEIQLRKSKGHLCDSIHACVSLAVPCKEY